jgi:hypothetical protein
LACAILYKIGKCAFMAASLVFAAEKAVSMALSRGDNTCSAGGTLQQFFA